MEASAEEAQRIQGWKIAQFKYLGFDPVAILQLLEWSADPHEADRLLYRGRERTTCTHEQALRILQPL